MLMSDHDIEDACRGVRPMIKPFRRDKLSDLTFLRDGKWSVEKIMSRGLSSYGYDATLSPNGFRVFSPQPFALIDPKRPDGDNWRAEAPQDERFILPARGFALAATSEYFRMPDDVTAICVGKSTYARSGLIVNVTPLEAGWHGEVTLELHNPNPAPMLIYANEGICQFLFIVGLTACDASYEARGGKYQGQRGVTMGKI